MYTEICQLDYGGIFMEHLTSKNLDISNLSEKTIKQISNRFNTFEVITILKRMI